MKTVVWVEHLRTWCLAGALLALFPIDSMGRFPMKVLDSPQSNSKSAYTVGSANTEGTREIAWEDLVPASTFEDLSESLTSDQLDHLDIISRTRELLQSEAVSVTDEMMGRAEKLEQDLNQQGMDVNRLLGILEEQRRQMSFAVVEELDGANVRMPGYVLPLEYDGNKVTEFFLVPYVGACMHAPVPPPNQMVHVRLTQGVKTGGLYDPVWVSGIMSTEARTSGFGFSDGDLDLSAGYTIDAQEVTPYE